MKQPIATLITAALVGCAAQSKMVPPPRDASPGSSASSREPVSTEDAAVSPTGEQLMDQLRALGVDDTQPWGYGGDGTSAAGTPSEPPPPEGAQPSPEQ